MIVWLEKALVGCNPESKLAKAIGNERKARFTLAIYLVAVALAFVNSWIAIAVYVAASLLWFIPDRRIERLL